MNPYEEIDTPTDQHADCQAVGRTLGFSVAAPLPDAKLTRAADRALRPAPSIHFDEYPREVPKAEIPISEAAQRLANALHLHLD